jgi:LytR cell envelope-related transcriptional attenuator
LEHLIKEIGAFAGLIAFLGLAVLALLAFSQARDIRRLREWAGSAPERDAERKESTSEAAAQRAEEIRRLEEARDSERRASELRDRRRQRREAGLPELTRTERLQERLEDARHRLSDPRYLAAAIVVFVLIAGGVAFAAIHGFGGGGGTAAHGRKAASLNPGDIEVTVLNGTAVSGLAARYGDKVERKGFKLGAITNSSASFAASVVMYEHGRAREAHKVGKALGIARLEPITPEISSVSAGAPVSVVVGQDNASSAG